MAGSDDIRKGAIIELDGKLLQIIEFQHIKMKRTALLKIKLRDVRDGHTIERTFQSRTNETDRYRSRRTT